MAYSLENKIEIEKDPMPEFCSLKASEQTWGALKEEITGTEFTTLELTWEAYQCQLDVVKGDAEKLQSLAERLHDQLTFEGLGVRDLSWETLHTALLTVQVWK